MRRKIINLNDFILYNHGANKGRINWKSNIGLDVNVPYNNKMYIIKITNYNEKQSRVIFKYLEKEYDMYTGHFLECKFGNVFKEKIYIKDKIKETQYNIDYDRCLNELKLTQNVIDNLTIGSKTKIFIMCKNCKKQKNNSVVFYNIYTKEQKCEYCSNGVSYSEKYFRNIMNQLNEQYIKTKFNWSNNREYDGYFKKYNLCIELHGNQHYEKGFDTLGGRTVELEQANDKYKKHLAKINGIKNYIQIDCRYSSPNYIKNNIIKSLSWLFDFSDVDWEKAHKECENSMVFEVCNIWMSLDRFNRNTTMLANMFNISKDSVKIYLKRGKTLNWSDYDPKEEIKKCAIKSNRQKRKKIICIDTKTVYNSISEVEKALKIPCSSISKCCNHKYGFKTAGGYTWSFVDDLTEEEYIKYDIENKLKELKKAS